MMRLIARLLLLGMIFEASSASFCDFCEFDSSFCDGGSPGLSSTPAAGEETATQPKGAVE